MLPDTNKKVKLKAEETKDEVPVCTDPGLARRNVAYNDILSSLL